MFERITPPERALARMNITAADPSVNFAQNLVYHGLYIAG